MPVSSSECRGCEFSLNCDIYVSFSRKLKSSMFYRTFYILMDISARLQGLSSVRRMLSMVPPRAANMSSYIRLGMPWMVCYVLVRLMVPGMLLVRMTLGLGTWMAYRRSSDMVARVMVTVRA